MSFFTRISIAVLLLSSQSLLANHPKNEDFDEGMEGSVRLGIPEPMVFDLVRPLGAAIGEFEVNSLFSSPLRAGKISWAPEVEYAFRKGSAVEFELPAYGREVEAYKVALQTTLPMKHTRKITHGVQGIGEVYRHKRGWETSGLYIFGVRWNRQWSTLSMGGVHVRDHEGGKSASSLVNHAVFFERFRRAALGVEVNAHGVRPSASQLLLTPQVHISLSRSLNLQIGAGRELRAGGPTNTVSWRFIRQF